MSQAKIQLLIDQGTHLNNSSSNKDIARQILEEINKLGRTFDITSVLNLIIEKVRTFNEKVALQALHLLEYIVENAPATFEMDVGRNRFLNEFARLLSPKHDADLCPNPIKEHITIILNNWVNLFPRQTKIALAYKALKSKDYLIKQHNTQYKDEKLGDEKSNKKLNLLLRSTNPADLILANRLIKSMVRREERRSLNIFTRKQKIDNAKENIQLLKDLIQSIRTGTDVDFSTVNEIKLTCDEFYKSLNLAADKVIDDNDPFLNELIKLSDDYVSVLSEFESCKKLMGVTTQPAPAPSSNNGNLVDLMDLDFNQNATAAVNPTNFNNTNQKSSLLDTDFLDIFSQAPPQATTPAYVAPISNINNLNFLGNLSGSGGFTQPTTTSGGTFNQPITSGSFNQPLSYNDFSQPVNLNFSTVQPITQATTSIPVQTISTSFPTQQISTKQQETDLFKNLNLMESSGVTILDKAGYINSLQVELNDIDITKTEPINNSHFTLCIAKGAIKPEFAHKLDTNRAQIYLVTVMNMSPSNYDNFRIAIKSNESTVKVFPLSSTSLKSFSPLAPPAILNTLFVTEKTSDLIIVEIHFIKDASPVDVSYPFSLSSLSK